MAKGFDYKLEPNGVVVVKPKGRRASVPLRSLLLFLVGFMLFKSLLVAHLGEPAYQDRLDRLRAGGMIEQAVAAVMQIDPVSRWVALEIGPILR
jgi:hypothetical protein